MVLKVDGAVFFLIVGFFFLVSCLIAWLVLFPSGRGQVIATLLAGITWLGGNLHRRQQALSGKTAFIGHSCREFTQHIGSIAKQHHPVLLAGFLVACVPAFIVLVFIGKHNLDGFDLPPSETNQQISELLKGERIVPPAPLPPEMFTTQDVLLVRPLLVSASRNWDKLNPTFEQTLLRVFRDMKEKHGYNMAIIEGYRSPERQDMLAELGNHVTNARAFQSYHQYGLAADCAFLRDGKLVISEKDFWAMRGYQLYGEVAERLGLKWGGRWKMMDFGHVELHLPN